MKSAKNRVISFPICPLVNMHYNIFSYMVKLDFPTMRVRKQRQMFSFKLSLQIFAMNHSNFCFDPENGICVCVHVHVLLRLAAVQLVCFCKTPLRERANKKAQQSIQI